MSHYDWLDKHLDDFVNKLNPDILKRWGTLKGLIGAHGDKCYCYRSIAEENNIHFYHFVAIYLLTYIRPYSLEVRETENGWVPPDKWIVENKDRFLPFLPPVLEGE